MDKRQYRSFMRKHRRDYVLSHPNVIKEANEKITHLVLNHMKTRYPQPEKSCIAGYWTMGHEVDALPLMHSLMAQGHCMALPKANGADRYLTFCQWTKDVKMEESDLGFCYPCTEDCSLIPNVIIVPLVAFDRRGYRLGYGKGYYDKTLEIIRHKDPTIQTLGLAYMIQQVDELPAEAHDIKLDAIATEEGIHWFTK